MRVVGVNDTLDDTWTPFYKSVTYFYGTSYRDTLGCVL